MTSCSALLLQRRFCQGALAFVHDALFGVLSRLAACNRNQGGGGSFSRKNFAQSIWLNKVSVRSLDEL